MQNPLPKPNRVSLPVLLCCLPLAAGAAPAYAPKTPRPAPETATLPDTPVSGRVLDENGQGLPGVTVLEKGTANGTSTGSDGRYTLNLEGVDSCGKFAGCVVTN